MSARPDGLSPSSDRSALAARIAAAGLDWIVPAWPAPGCVHAFFTTRNDGASVGAQVRLDPGASSLMESARREAMAESHRGIRAFVPSPPVWLDQVHGSDVAIVNDSSSSAAQLRPPRADAAVTRRSDVVLAVRVADCLPVIFSDLGGSVIGIAHAGWRGLAAGVLERTIAAMASDPADVVAWLGPAIGKAAFEVGDDVRDAFVGPDSGADAAFSRGREGKWHADLDALARRRLARAGVSAVFGGGICTVSDPARFFSFRRDGTTGRMAAFVWRTRA